MANVLIVAEYGKGKLKKATLNAIGFGRQAAQKLSGKLFLLVIGKDVSGIAAQAAPFGAEKIFLADDPGLEHYLAETWAAVVVQAAKACDAKIVGMTSTTTGKDLMPRAAGKLGAGMASDIIGFDGETFLRSMWAGNALASVKVNTAVKVATVQGTAFAAAEPSGGQSAVEKLPISLPKTRTRFVEMKETVSTRPELTEARVVVSGGRGMKGPENFKLLEDFADLFRGAIGATRAAVDAGWVPNDLQVGQTGKIVAPELYVAVGLSGAIQHLAGMKNSKVIVAINKDAEAPIFQVADYGLVADLFKAMPELTAEIKKELK